MFRGNYECPRCGFVLHKRLLRTYDFAVGIDTAIKREVCPNDGADLTPIDEEVTDDDTRRA